MKLRIPLAIIAATLIVPATASAEAPVAGCGAGKTLLSVDAAFDELDKQIYDDDELEIIRSILAGVDANGDDHLCFKAFAPNRGLDQKYDGTDYMISQVLDNKSEGRPTS